MEIRELLPPEHIVVPLPGPTIREALDALVQRLIGAGAVRNPELLARIAGEPRLRDVVAVSSRVALPHYRTDAVDRLVMALGVAPEPLDGSPAAIDASPRIVALVLAPPGAATLYLQAVSTLARLFRRDEVVDRIVNVRSGAELFALPELAGVRIQPRLTVRDLMVHRTESVAPDTPLRMAIELMIRHGLRAIPVVGAKREVLGMVTDRDVIRAILPQVPRAGGDETPAATPNADTLVRDVMSRSVLCISEDMGLDEVASIMINKDVEQLPVVSEGRLTGFLTRSEMIRKLFGR